MEQQESTLSWKKAKKNKKQKQGKKKSKKATGASSSDDGDDDLAVIHQVVDDRLSHYTNSND
jgi:hypothetical protein